MATTTSTSCDVCGKPCSDGDTVIHCDRDGVRSTFDVCDGCLPVALPKFAAVVNPPKPETPEPGPAWVPEPIVDATPAPEEAPAPAKRKRSR